MMHGLAKIKAVFLKQHPRSHDESEQAPFQPYVHHKCVEGVDFDLLIGDATGREWYDVQATDPHWPELGWLRDHLVQSGDLVIECGGHHGCTTVVLANWVGPGGYVLTLEANPHNARILQRTVQINGLANVGVLPSAAGSARGSVCLSASSNAAVLPRHRRRNEARSVPVVAVDDLLCALDADRCLLKIDVERYELEVLRGAVRLLKARPKLAIEVHVQALANYGALPTDILGLLGPLGYRGWMRLDDAGPFFDFDSEPQARSLEACAHTHLFLKAAR